MMQPVEAPSAALSPTIPRNILETHMDKWVSICDGEVVAEADSYEELEGQSRFKDGATLFVHPTSFSRF